VLPFLRSKAAPPFVIVRQERSGTTFIQTLLSSYEDIHCRGELFDTWKIDDIGQKITDQATVFSRETDPDTFLQGMLAGKGMSRPHPKILGFKFLTHHAPDVLTRIIPANPHWRIIYVTRGNKLARFASKQQVAKTGQWTMDNGRATASTPPHLESTLTRDGHCLSATDFS
jgi:hypothetical protein